MVARWLLSRPWRHAAWVRFTKRRIFTFLDLVFPVWLIHKNFALCLFAGTDHSIRKVHSILLWDSFSDFRLEDGTGMFTRFKCPQKDCTVTRNRSVLADSAVVLFHMRETTIPDQLPVRGDALQRWVFAMKEPPVYSQFDAQSFNGLFDWTMTYRPDSDVPWPYGSFYLSSKPKSTLPDYHNMKTENQKSQIIP